MPALRDVQLAFIDAVVAGAEQAIAGELRVRGGTPASRLAIYRNNTFSNLRGALRESYAVVHRLVGDAFFDHAADQFIATHPSSSGDLNEYGEGFAEFLAAYPHARELPYLPDVAHLDWARERAFYAPDATPLDPARLAEVAPERQGELRFRLNPAARLIDSPWPILAIWETNQPDYTGDGEADLGAGGNWLLVTRRGLETLIESMPEAEYRFLAALAAGQGLADAADAALAADGSFDLGASLVRRVRLTDLVDFWLPGE